MKNFRKRQARAFSMRQPIIAAAESALIWSGNVEQAFMLELLSKAGKMPNTGTVARAGENVRNRENNRRIVDHHMYSLGPDHLIPDFRFESGRIKMQRHFMNPCRRIRSLGIEVPHAVRAGIPA